MGCKHTPIHSETVSCTRSREGRGSGPASLAAVAFFSSRARSSSSYLFFSPCVEYFFCFGHHTCAGAVTRCYSEGVLTGCGRFLPAHAGHAALHIAQSEASLCTLESTPRAWRRRQGNSTEVPGRGMHQERPCRCSRMLPLLSGCFAAITVAQDDDRRGLSLSPSTTRQPGLRRDDRACESTGCACASLAFLSIRRASAVVTHREVHATVHLPRYRLHGG